MNPKSKQFIFSLLILLITSLVFPKSSDASFRFVTWGDSRDTPSVLASLSNQVKTLNPAPVFTLFNGDLCGSWTTTCIQAWIGYMNGSSNNGNVNIAFPVRGNHDSGSGTAWSTYFNQSATASRVGASNYSALTQDMTYSFDYQNAHFVGIDLPGGDVSSMSSAQITWLDNDLKAAEARGQKVSFLYWHGPIYYVSTHASTPSNTLVNVLNNHPSIFATYHGHEHVVAHTTLDSSRIAGLTNNTIEEFVDGTAGAPAYSCTAGRSDFCQNYNAFAVTDVVSDTEVVVSVYKQGSNTPVFTKTITKNPTGWTPPPTATPSPTPHPTATPVPTHSPSPTPTMNPSKADVNGDHTVNIVDIGIVVDNYGLTNPPNPRADVNGDGIVNIVDIGIIVDHYNQTGL